MTTRTSRRRRGGSEVTDEFTARLRTAVMVPAALDKHRNGEISDDDCRVALERAIAEVGGAELLVQPLGHLALQLAAWLAEIEETSVDHVFVELHARASEGARPNLTLIRGGGRVDPTPEGAA
jgi:hypothetical protein